MQVPPQGESQQTPSTHAESATHGVVVEQGEPSGTAHVWRVHTPFSPQAVPSGQ